MAHIAEVDEHLDYGKFWTFPESVDNITVAAGHRFWETLEGLADSYPCPPCKPGAVALAHGGHDVVNLLLGKEAHTPQEFERLVGMVQEAKKRWDKMKRHVGCKGSTCPRRSVAEPPHAEAHVHG